jgi:transcription initiation factor TFIIB
MEKEERVASAEQSAEKKENTRASRNDFSPSERPSQARLTVGQDGPCQECGAKDWETDDIRGEVVCGACGLVVEENVIDPRAEWVNHGDGPDRSRVGAPSTPLLADKGLNTKIDRSDLSGTRASMNGIRGKALRDWRRRAVIDDRTKTRDSRTRNLVKAMQFIRDRSDLPRGLQQQAAEYYRKAAEKGLVTGRSIRGVAASCCYLAARENGLPRPIEDFGAKFDMEDDGSDIGAMRAKELNRTIRLVSRELGLHRISGPEEYLNKFHSDLGLPPQVLGEANELWAAVNGSMEWQGKKPAGVAGVLLYKAAQNRGSPRTQSDVCKVAGVSEVTLRGLLRLLEGLLDSVGFGSVN